MNTEVMFSSKTGMWETPQDFFDKWDSIYDFHIDVCATKEDTKCEKFISPEQDALVTPWNLENNPHYTMWCNPPYGRGIGKWVKKASETIGTVVMLLPARIDTKWFHEYIYEKENVCTIFIAGRLKFGGSKNSAPFPSMIVIFEK